MPVVGTHTHKLNTLSGVVWLVQVTYRFIVESLTSTESINDIPRFYKQSKHRVRIKDINLSQ